MLRELKRLPAGASRESKSRTLVLEATLRGP